MQRWIPELFLAAFVIAGLYLMPVPAGATNCPVGYDSLGPRSPQRPGREDEIFGTRRKGRGEKVR